MFIQRVASIWTELPEKLIEAGTVTTFQRHLDRYLNEQSIEGYGFSAGKWD